MDIYNALEYFRKAKEIITVYVHPPIPIRDFDWCAYRDGTEESGVIGWGSTEEIAINDLLAREEGW